MHLGIAELVGDVVKSFGRGPLPAPVEQLFGDVNPKHLAGHGGARGLPGAAPNVQHTFGTADARRGAEAVVEPAQLGIVVIGHHQRHSRSTTCSAISRSGYSTNRSPNISSATRPTRVVHDNGRGSAPLRVPRSAGPVARRPRPGIESARHARRLPLASEGEEKNSVAIASKEAFGGCTKTFANPRFCAAIVDRLTFGGQHHRNQH
jgi:hypothetical protein